MNAEGIDPCLGSFVARGVASTVTESPCHGWWKWFKGLPTPMSFQVQWSMEVILWLFWYPPVGPEGFFQRVVQPFGPGHWKGLVLLVVVPFAKPHGMLRCRWNLAEWALFGGGVILETDGSLVPGADVVGLDLAEVFGDFGCRGPVNPADKGLTVASAGKSMLALLFGLVHACFACVDCMHVCMHACMFRKIFCSVPTYSLTCICSHVYMFETNFWRYIGLHWVEGSMVLARPLAASAGEKHVVNKVFGWRQKQLKRVALAQSVASWSLSRRSQ